MNGSDQLHEGIAIIGMAGRFSSAVNLEVLWEHITRGREFKDGPAATTSLETEPQRVLENTGSLDPGYFKMSAQEIEGMSLQDRVLLECASEALQNAGYDSLREDIMIGLFTSLNASGPAVPQPVGPTGQVDGAKTHGNLVPSRIATMLNLRGPSIGIQAGASSSLVAAAVACQHLLTYQCDLALAGGISLGGAGEGAGVVVLKRSGEALADRDQIFAIIKGFAVNNDGPFAGDAGSGRERSQVDCITLAHAMADIVPESIGYHEVNGAAFQHAPFAGLAEAFQGESKATGFCALGSVQSVVGNLDATEGIAGLISATLALHHKQIPPLPARATIAAKAEFTNTPFCINSGLTEWKQSQAPRCAAVSSFGNGGTNAHLVLEEAPAPGACEPARPTQLLIVSAHNDVALEAATANLAAHLERHPEQNLADVAHTLQTGRRELDHRRALVVHAAREAVEALQTLDPGRVVTRKPAPEPPSVIFMFPGPESARAGMGGDLYQHEPGFREEVDRCAKLLLPHLGLDVRAVLYPAEHKRASAAEQLAEPRIQGPATFVIEYALAKLWMSWGITPEAMLACNPGEFVPACLAGVLSLKDALCLAAAQGKVIQQLPPGATMDIQLPEEQVQHLLDGFACLAAVNAPGMCAIAGSHEGLAQLQQHLLEHSTACQLMSTRHGLHPAGLEPFMAPFRNLVRKVRLRPPRIPYLSNVTGNWITPEQATNPEYWSQQLMQPMRFAEGLNQITRNNQPIFIEVGPGHALCDFVALHPAGAGNRLTLASLNDKQLRRTEMATLLHALGQLWLVGLPIDWKNIHPQETRRRVSLPTYPLERSPIETKTVPRHDPPAPVSVHRMEPTPQPPQAKATRNHPFKLPITQPSLTSKPVPMASSTGSRWNELPDFDFTSLRDTKKPLDSRLNPPASLETQENKNGSEDSKPSGPDAESVANGIKTVRLTEAQREIWYAVQLDDGLSSAFNQSTSIKLSGTLDLPGLVRAFQWLVDRHEALRITFSTVEDVQFVHPVRPVSIPVKDLSSQPVEARKEQLRTLFKQMADEPFDLVNGPMYRVQLVQLSANDHVLLLTLHHLICDGGSVGILLRELGECYSAQIKGEPPPGAVPLAFSEFALEQNASLQTPGRIAAEKFWLEQYSRPASVMELPTDLPRPSKMNFAGGSRNMGLNPLVGQGLKRLSTKNRCTLFMTLLTGYSLLLHRLTGQPEVIIGLPMTHRSGESAQLLVGHCVNFLPLRLNMAGNPTFTEHLNNVRRLLLDAHEHQNYTLGTLLQKLNLPREPGRTPLTSVMFNLDWMRGATKLEGLETKVVPNPYCHAHFDISFSLSECEDEMELHCHYSAELFHAETIERWFKHYETLLASMAANPEQRIGSLQLLTADERSQLLVEWPRSQAETLAALTRNSSTNSAVRFPFQGSTESLRLYVLDGYQEPSPCGVPGELWVSCAKDAVIPEHASPTDLNGLADPFRPEPGIQLYRTGIRACYSAAGRLEIRDMPAEQVAADRQHLNSPELDSPALPKTGLRQSGEPVAPESPFSPTEETLAQMWREVIGQEKIGRHDNFFDLGGHSVLLMQVVTRVRKTFGLDLTLRHMFEAPTIGELAKAIEDRLTHSVPARPAEAPAPLATPNRT